MASPAVTCTMTGRARDTKCEQGDPLMPLNALDQHAAPSSTFKPSCASEGRYALLDDVYIMNAPERNREGVGLSSARSACHQSRSIGPQRTRGLGQTQ